MVNLLFLHITFQEQGDRGAGLVYFCKTQEFRHN